MTKTAAQVKEAICEIGRRVYNKGFVAANDGNISVRIDEERILVTPTGQSKGFLSPEMIIMVDMDGRVLEGKLQPSSETKMHLRVYQERLDVHAVVHAHPPYATVCAIANQPLVQALVPEAVLSLGTVPVAKYGTPSTEEVPDAVQEYLQQYTAVLLENHGALTWGRNLQEAYFKMETLEFYAQMTYMSQAMPGAKEISQQNLEKLGILKEKLGL
jgi:L-fuculose-phosphate aldolase